MSRCIEVRGLTKVFPGSGNRPDVRAVERLDFEVENGEIYCLLGPSGCGGMLVSGALWVRTRVSRWRNVGVAKKASPAM